MNRSIYIIAAKRTPIGSFNGSLSSIPATKLGATAIKAAMDAVNCPPELVNEVFMGNVLSAGLGQAPARQAAIFAGIPNTVPCTTVNKVCASGMKAIQLAAQSIALGENDLVVAGGMENMSLAPHYLENSRKGYRYGHFQAIDGLLKDGLTDAYDQKAMGCAAELCSREENISREEQDKYAITSYKRSEEAWSKGLFDNEIAPVEVPQRKGDPLRIDTDEEYTNVKFEKIPSLRPVFEKEGTVTAANASTINDGAAAVILASEEMVAKLGVKPLAVIKAWADAAQEPERFTTAPAKALPRAIERADLSFADIDFLEINEAFSVVSLANIKRLGLDPHKVNIHGGAVSLGHPLGCSGARIIVTLINVLHQNNGKIGAAGICNGGGGASAMVIERIS